MIYTVLTVSIKYVLNERHWPLLASKVSEESFQWYINNANTMRSNFDLWPIQDSNPQTVYALVTTALAGG